MRTLLAILVIALVGCVHYQQHFNYSATMKAKDTVVIIETIGELPSGYPTRGFKAIGFSIGNGYIVALTHATNLTEMFPGAIFKSSTYSIGDDELELIGRYDDISLFKSNMDRPSIPFGDSDQLKYGTHVVIIGFSLTAMINIKDGVVTSPDVPEMLQEPLLAKTFMTNAPMNPGDSGSPVIAFRDGNPEIIGIACITIPMAKGMNFAFKSNYVQEAIKKILEVN